MSIKKSLYEVAGLLGPAKVLSSKLKILKFYQNYLLTNLNSISLLPKLMLTFLPSRELQFDCFVFGVCGKHCYIALL